MTEGTAKELDVLDVRRSKKSQPKRRKMITYETTTVWLAIICGAMATWILQKQGLITWDGELQKYGIIIVDLLCITLSICYVCEKLVKGHNKEKTPADD